MRTGTLSGAHLSASSPQGLEVPVDAFRVLGEHDEGDGPGGINVGPNAQEIDAERAGNPQQLTLQVVLQYRRRCTCSTGQFLASGWLAVLLDLSLLHADLQGLHQGAASHVSVLLVQPAPAARPYHCLSSEAAGSLCASHWRKVALAMQTARQAQA